MNESKIISSILSGNVDRYSDLVERYQIGLLIYCERLVGNRVEAEDITQQSFIKAYEKLSSFNSVKGRFSTWLYRIAYNESVDYLRKTRRIKTTSEIEEIEPVAPDFLRDELLNEVRSAVLALMPPEHRRAIEAYYWEGKGYQAIADEMGVPINTVKSWLHRAKTQLKGVLA